MAEAMWKEYAEAYAFLGNSLLKPMSQTPAVGLDPEFWQAFPRFGSDAVDAAVQACESYARRAQVRSEQGADVVLECSVEFTDLFVGPPAPAAAPWETMYRGENVTVGFGEATFEMRRLLRSVGLELGNSNNQYEDHMGIELLLLSVLCGRAEDEAAPADIASYARSHPLGWIAGLREKVAASHPEGYFVGVIDLARAMMENQFPQAR